MSTCHQVADLTGCPVADLSRCRQSHLYDWTALSAIYTNLDHLVLAIGGFLLSACPQVRKSAGPLVGSLASISVGSNRGYSGELDPILVMQVSASCSFYVDS